MPFGTLTEALCAKTCSDSTSSSLPQSFSPTSSANAWQEGMAEAPHAKHVLPTRSANVWAKGIAPNAPPTAQQNKAPASQAIVDVPTEGCTTAPADVIFTMLYRAVTAFHARGFVCSATRQEALPQQPRLKCSMRAWKQRLK